MIRPKRSPRVPPADRSRHRRGTADILVLWSAVGIALLPLVVDSGSFHQHVTTRWWLLGLILTVGLVAGFNRTWSAARPTHIWWLALAGVTLLATAFSVNPLDALIGDSGRRGGLVTTFSLIGVVGLGIAARHDRQRVLRVAPVATFIVVGGIVITLVSEEVSLVTSQSVFVGNSGQLGGYLLLLCGCNLAVFVGDRARLFRCLAGVALPLGALSLLLTGSYSAVLGFFFLMVSGSALGWWNGRRDDQPPLTARLTIDAAGATGLTACVVALTWSAQFRGFGTSVAGRVDTWSAAVHVIQARPILGWGPEGFRHGFALVVPPEFVIRWGDERLQDRAHNVFLDQAATTGVIGLIVLIALTLATARQLELEDPVGRWLTATIGGSGVFLLGWFPAFDIGAVAALLVGLAFRRRAATKRPSPSRRHAGTARALTVVGILGGLLITTIGAVAVVQDHRLTRQLDAINEGGLAPRASMVVDAYATATSPTAGFTERLLITDLLTQTSLSTLEAAIAVQESRPSWQSGSRDAEVAFGRGELHLAAGQRSGDRTHVTRATAAYREAVRLAPHHRPAWRGLGVSLMLLDDPAAEGAFRQVLELRPDEVGPRFDLAALMLRQGDPDAAARWADEACRIDPHDPQLVALVDQIIARDATPNDCT